MMIPCQGLAAANAQLVAFPVAKRNPYLARRGLSAFLKLQNPLLRHEKPIFPLRAGGDLVHHGTITSFPRDNSIQGIPSLQRRGNMQSRSQVACRASISSFSYPELTSKPRWWWRTLACVPYLLPLHNMWSYADVIYQLHPYLEGYGLPYAFIDTMALFPGWLLLMLFMTVYFFVVRRKWSPHFLRFHIILAILLDTGSQAIATMCTWMPSIVYNGKPMAYFWMAMAFVQIYTVLECMRCALAGIYPDVPFVSDTAYIHSDLSLFRY